MHKLYNNKFIILLVIIEHCVGGGCIVNLFLDHSQWGRGGGGGERGGGGGGGGGG